MAIFTGEEGFFEVTAISFTPKIIAIGETTNFSITIKNISGTKVTSCYIRMFGHYPSTEAPGGIAGTNSEVYLHGGPSFAMQSISWANNASKTFTGTFTWDLLKSYPLKEDSTYSYDFDMSTTKLHLDITTEEMLGSDGRHNYDNFDNLRGQGGSYLSLIKKRDNPRLTFNLERTPNDEAEYVAATIKLSADVSASTLTSHGYFVKLYCSTVNNPATTSDTEVTLNATIEQMYAGITFSTSAITRSFSNGSDWHFLLRIDDTWESQQAVCDVPRAFANAHFSGLATGGVCFGGFCSSVANDPKLESYYPLHLYGGIGRVRGDRIQDSLAALGVQCGMTETLSCASSAAKAFSITFKPRYLAPPVMVVGLGSSLSTYRAGQISAYVVPDTLTEYGCAIGVSNYSGSTSNVCAHWIAIGNPDWDNSAIVVVRPQGAMTSNSSRSCVASASTTNSSSYPAWKAFDASAATSWASSSSDSAPWIQLQMDMALKNIQLSVYSRSQNASAGNHNPTAGNVQGSNNGSTWTTIGSYSGWAAKNDGTLLGTIDCANETAYKYVRLNVTSRAGSEYVAIGYISVRGEI